MAVGGERAGQSVQRWSERLNRRIDRSLVRGQFHVIGLLAIAAVAVAAVSAIAMLALHAIPDTGGRDQGPVEAGWQALVRTIDPGQITTDHGAAAVIGLGTTIFGLLLISTLISIVNNQVERRVDRVKRGRDPVRLRRQRRDASDRVPYYLVLGWTDLTLRLLEELADSHLPHQPPDVLVMAPMTYEDMTERIEEFRRETLIDPSSSTLSYRQRLPTDRDWPQVRTGRPTDTRDLHRIAAITGADAVIILAPDPPDGMTSVLHGFDEMCPATAEVVKTTLAVSACLPNRDTDVHGATEYAARKHPAVVVELPESVRSDSGLAGRLHARTSDSDMELVILDVASLQSSLAADVSRTAGLAAIYRDILDFKGAEFHLIEPGPTQRTFGQAVAAMRNGIIIGTVDTADSEHRTNLWPDWDEDLAGKLLVSLQDDASTPVFDPDAPTETGPRGVGAGALTDPEQVLLIGWNHRGEHLVRALDRRLPPGSRVSVVTSAPDGPELRLPNIGTVAVQRVDGVQRWLDTTRSELGCDHAIVLGDDRLPPAASDANVLLTLLALRPPHSGSDKPDTVVAELRQRPNRYLASQRFSDDLIVGDALIAMLLAQFAADPNLTEVIEELISPSSTHPLEIRLMPMSGGTSSAGLSFRSVQADLRARDGSIALGYRIVHHCDSDAEHQRSELHLNPDGDDPMPERDDTRVELVVLTRCDRHVDLTPATATPTRGRAQV